MVRTADAKTGRSPVVPATSGSRPAASGARPAASGAASGAAPVSVPVASVPTSGKEPLSTSHLVPDVSDATSGKEPLSTSHSVAQCNGTEDPLLVYCPEGGFTDDDSILAAIDLVENTPANNYLTEAKMARYTDGGVLKAIHFQRLKVFQLIVNLINGALAIVGQSVAIKQIKL